MADKDFKTVKEQLNIFRSRGLTINDEAQASKFYFSSKSRFKYTSSAAILKSQHTMII